MLCEICGGQTGSVTGFPFSSEYFSFPLSVTIPLMLDIETHMLGPFKDAVVGVLILTSSKQSEIIVIIMTTTECSEILLHCTVV